MDDQVKKIPKNVPNSYGKTPWADLLPDGDLDICEENIEMLFKMMVDRQNIWVNRAFPNAKIEVTDEILLNSKFTNIYRELDRNSQYQISQILLDDELSDIDLIWKMIFYRIYNNPNTFQYIERTRGHKAGIPNLTEWSEEEFTQSIKELRAMGENPFTNAYLINSMACPGKTRDECYCGKVMPTLFNKIFEIFDCVVNCKTPEEMITMLETLPGVSGFVSHEIYQDLTYIERYTDRGLFKFNQDDFTNVGPGCEVGLRLCFPSEATKKGKVEKIGLLTDLANSGIFEEMGFKFLSWNKKEKKYEISDKGKVTKHAIEMSCCEQQKYWKMVKGVGKQRSKYEGKVIDKDYSFYLY